MAKTKAATPTTTHATTARTKTRSSRNAIKHGFSARPRPTQQHRPGVTELANAIAGTDASAMRRDAALQLAEAEFEYRRIEQYKLALIDAEIGHALKSMAMDDLSQEEIMRLQAQALSDPQGAWRVIRILNKLERYETPRWNQLCRALGRYAAVET